MRSSTPHCINSVVIQAIRATCRRRVAYGGLKLCWGGSPSNVDVVSTATAYDIAYRDRLDHISLPDRKSETSLCTAPTEHFATDGGRTLEAGNWIGRIVN